MAIKNIVLAKILGGIAAGGTCLGTGVAGIVESSNARSEILESSRKLETSVGRKNNQIKNIIEHVRESGNLNGELSHYISMLQADAHDNGRHIEEIIEHLNGENRYIIDTLKDLKEENGRLVEHFNDELKYVIDTIREIKEAKGRSGRSVSITKDTNWRLERLEKFKDGFLKLLSSLSNVFEETGINIQRLEGLVQEIQTVSSQNRETGQYLEKQLESLNGQIETITRHLERLELQNRDIVDRILENEHRAHNAEAKLEREIEIRRGLAGESDIGKLGGYDAGNILGGVTVGLRGLDSHSGSLQGYTTGLGGESGSQEILSLKLDSDELE